MIQKVNAPVAVYFKSDPIKKEYLPVRVKWGVNTYTVAKLTLHTPRYIGRTLYHEYCVLADNLLLVLRLNTATMQWVLLEYDNGES